MVSAALERLLAVQDLDTSISQLEHRRDTLAERSGLSAAQAELAQLGSARDRVERRRDELLAAQRDLESQIATVVQRKEELERRMYAARSSSARDLQAMSDEVAHLAQRQAELEEQELVVLVDQDPVNEELEKLETARAPLQERTTALTAEVAEALRALGAELATATAARAARAGELPPALAERYERVRAHLKGVGAARLVGNRCDGCHLELSSVEVERIRSLPDGAVETCEQCGRILVPA